MRNQKDKKVGIILKSVERRKRVGLYGFVWVSEKAVI